MNQNNPFPINPIPEGNPGNVKPPEWWIQEDEDWDEE